MKKWMLLLSLVLMIVIVNCGQAQAAEKTATKDITLKNLMMRMYLSSSQEEEPVR